MLFSVEQAFVGREEIRAPLKTPAWETSWVQGNSNGPLVTMVRLVPIENDVIPVVLLINMHLIKGT